MGNVNMEASQINYRGGESKMSVEEALKQTSGEAAAIAALQTAVGNLQTGKTDLTVVAPAFSDAVAYAIGALVTYQGKTYRCTTAHEGEWDAMDFTETTVAAEIAAIQGDVSDLEGTKAAQMTIAPFFSSETAYDPGDIVYYNGLSYRCTNAHEGAWDSADFAATTVAFELDLLKSGLTNHSFTDSINMHAQWVETSISDVTNYAGKVIYGYMTDTTLGRTYTFVAPVNNIPQVQTPIWVQHDLTDTGNSDSIFVAKSDQTNALCIFLGANIPDITVYLFVH